MYKVILYPFLVIVPLHCALKRNFSNTEFQNRRRPCIGKFRFTMIISKIFFEELSVRLKIEGVFL